MRFLALEGLVKHHPAGKHLSRSFKQEMSALGEILQTHLSWAMDYDNVYVISQKQVANILTSHTVILWSLHFPKPNHPNRLYPVSKPMQPIHPPFQGPIQTSVKWLQIPAPRHPEGSAWPWRVPFVSVKVWWPKVEGPRADGSALCEAVCCEWCSLWSCLSCIVTIDVTN